MPINPQPKREVKPHEIQVGRLTAMFHLVEGSLKAQTVLHLVAVKEGNTMRAPTQEELERIAAHLKKNPAPHEVSLPQTVEEAMSRFEGFKSLVKSSPAFYREKRRL